MKVIGLIRVSTTQQVEHGASLAAQQRAFHDWARVHNAKVCDTVVGQESASGRTEERRLFLALRESIIKHSPTHIWMIEHSRLTRGDELEAAIVHREIQERGIDLIVGGQVRRLDSSEDRFVLRIQSAVDRAEAERISERSRRGKRERARQGKWATGSPAFGYRNPAVGELHRGTLQIVPDQAAIVRRIFALVAAGDTVNSVHIRLNAEGVRTPKGYGQWGNPTLRRMLTNPVYIGTIEANRWHHDGRRITKQTPQVVTRCAHEPIIDMATWNRVQSRLSGVRRHGLQPALLTGLLFVDGQRLVGDSNGRRKFYFRRGGPYIHRDHADAVVWDGFVRMIQSPQWIEMIRKQLSADSRSADAKVAIEQHDARIRKLERRLEGLTTMRADGEISKAEFSARAEELRAQIHASRNAIAACAEPVSAQTDELQRTFSAVRAIVSDTNMSPANRRRLIESVSDRIDARVEREARLWKLRDVSIGLMEQRQLSSVDSPYVTRVCVLLNGVPVLRVERVRRRVVPARAVGGVAC